MVIIKIIKREGILYFYGIIAWSKALVVSLNIRVPENMYLLCYPWQKDYYSSSRMITDTCIMSEMFLLFIQYTYHVIFVHIVLKDLIDNIWWIWHPQSLSLENCSSPCLWASIKLHFYAILFVTVMMCSSL